MIKFAACPIPEEKKKQMREDYLAKTVLISFDAMENKLKLNKSQCFLVGKSNTIADFYFIGTCRDLISSKRLPEFKSLLEKYPLISAYFNKQNANMSSY